ncbi:ATP phosphoribosyltransferase [Lachnellula hyalina]|uniref:ATP phosphoribosyltransferase n=1 Tax=Lachnellula hyalina TaxID=1316788 RepID=A0A8H8R3K8_9HELO|nr:ATP phosphoribosyltransferase [Lachnellula hyalina]TVY27421.1 ATP phosphoribosyltransferase [Lachnellula hyalina]
MPLFEEPSHFEFSANKPQSLEGRLLFAVPKKGRLLQAALNLLEGADIQFRRESRLDIALVKNLPIALVFLPAADIPTFVGEGRVSLGITGRDTVAEHEAAVTSARRERAESSQSTPIETDTQLGCEEVMDLSFGACKLEVQVPVKGQYVTPSDLIGKNVGTSFVHLAEEYFAGLEKEADAANGEGKRKLRTNIIELSGSVEAACALGVADGIVDLVESGETMKAAGLKAIDTVVSSVAVLIKSKHPSNPALVDLLASRIRGVITAQQYVLCQYNVKRTDLVQAAKITPGKRAPTINALEEEGWMAVSSMVEKKKIATVMDELTAMGATDILVLNIANTRTD